MKTTDPLTDPVYRRPDGGGHLERIWWVYQIVGYLTGLWVWLGGSLSLFAAGQIGACFVWLTALGPIVAGIAGLLWPFYLIWFFGGPA
jgi:hypothetical protein